MEQPIDSVKNSGAFDSQWPKLAFRGVALSKQKIGLIILILSATLLVSLVLFVLTLNSRDSLPNITALVGVGILIVSNILAMIIVILRHIGVEQSGILLDSDRLIERNAAQRTRVFTYNQINFVRPYYRGGVEIHYYPITGDGKVSDTEIRETYLIHTVSRNTLAEELYRRMNGLQPTQEVHRRYLNRQGIPIMAFLGSGLLMLAPGVVLVALNAIRPDLVTGPVGAIIILSGLFGCIGLPICPVAAHLYINRYGGVPVSRKNSDRWLQIKNEANSVEKS
jgi:hypothetical protein